MFSGVPYIGSAQLQPLLQHLLPAYIIDHACAKSVHQPDRCIKIENTCNSVCMYVWKINSVCLRERKRVPVKYCHL